MVDVPSVREPMHLSRHIFNKHKSTIRHRELRLIRLADYTLTIFRRNGTMISNRFRHEIAPLHTFVTNICPYALPIDFLMSNFTIKGPSN